MRSQALLCGVLLLVNLSDSLKSFFTMKRPIKVGFVKYSNKPFTVSSRKQPVHKLTNVSSTITPLERYARNKRKVPPMKMAEYEETAENARRMKAEYSSILNNEKFERYGISSLTRKRKIGTQIEENEDSDSHTDSPISSRTYDPINQLFSDVATKLFSMIKTLQTLIATYNRMFFSKSSTKASQNAIKARHLSASYELLSDSRIQKELRMIMKDNSTKVSVGNNIRQWIITLPGANGTLYAGEKLRLKFSFPTDYPFSPPSVYFLHPVPKHEHVYSNGDICLDLLGPGWMPTMTAQGLSISIQSMLSSARDKMRPPDNALHADNSPGQQQVGWLYHDDKC